MTIEEKTSRGKKEMLNTEKYDTIVEKLLEAPYYVIDFLPRQVPADCGGQYFAVEAFFLRQPRKKELYRKFAHLVLCLNCYYDMAVTDGKGWAENPLPEELYKRIEECADSDFLNILIKDEDSLVTFNGGDLYMTLYHPSEGLMETVRQLAAAEGLFVSPR